MPSILDYISFNNPSVTFGKSIFDRNFTPFFIYYSNDQYYLLRNSLFSSFDGNKFSFLNQKLNTSDVDSFSITEHQNYLKAYIQEYNTRMICNKMNYQ